MAAVGLAFEAAAEGADAAELAIAVEAIDDEAGGSGSRGDIEFVEGGCAVHAVAASGGVGLDDELTVFEGEGAVGAEQLAAAQVEGAGVGEVDHPVVVIDEAA